MNLKKSLVIVLIGLVVSVVEADPGKNKKDAIKRKVLSRAFCPRKYSEYVNNCTAQFDIGLKKCGEQEEAEKLKLKEASAQNREKFVHDADNSCQAVTDCDDDDRNVADIYGCMAEVGLKSATSMKTMSYKASILQLNYNKQKQLIENERNTCTNATTKVLGEKNSAAIDELNKCFRTGKWELVEVPESSLPTDEVPTVSENPVTTVVSKKPIDSARNPNQNAGVAGVSETAEEAAKPKAAQQASKLE